MSEKRVMEEFQKDVNFLRRGVRPPEWMTDETWNTVIIHQVNQMLANPTVKNVKFHFDSLIYNELDDWSDDTFNQLLEMMVQRLKDENL